MYLELYIQTERIAENDFHSRTRGEEELDDRLDEDIDECW